MSKVYTMNECYTMSMSKHIVQSKQWGNFKSSFGTPAVSVDNVQYTIHKIPKTNFSYAYCPKVNPFEINWKKIVASAKDNNVFAINFDVPNIIVGTKEEEKAKKIFEKTKNVRLSPKNTFTKNNILLDISQSEDVLLKNMHAKQRYNTRYAKKKGVKIREATDVRDLNIFLQLQRETAKRQKFLIHPDSYFEQIWELLKEKNMAHLLIAEFDNTPLVAWMLFIYENTLYYQYGGSSVKHKNLQASSLIGWEAIRLGKKYNCSMFDMWGACKNLEDRDDPEWGFTNFKLKFGGKYVEYMDSYDYVLNAPLYNLFNFIYPKALKLLRLLK